VDDGCPRGLRSGLSRHFVAPVPRASVDAAALAALFTALQRSPTTMAKPATTKKNKPLSKSEILNAIADEVGEEISRKHV
jgi:hypothetical protein